MSAHHTSPQAQPRLAVSVLIYVKSLLKILKTVNWQHQKGPCFNITQLHNALIDDSACQEIAYPNNHACKCNRPWSQMLLSEKTLYLPALLVVSHDASEEHLSLSSSYDSASLLLLLFPPSLLSNFTSDSVCNLLYHLLHGPTSTWQWGKVLGT